MSGGRVWRVVIDHPGGANERRLLMFRGLLDTERHAQLGCDYVAENGGRAHVEWADLGPWTKENQ